MTFLENLEKRRSIYTLGKNVDTDKAIETIKQAVRLSPTAFNSQSTRVLFLTGAAQDKLWDEIVTNELQAVMKDTPADAWEATKARIAGFKAAAGTALFFEDQDVVKGLQEQFALYADAFPFFSEQASGISSVNAWTALSDINVGANLQHYNPLIDAKVASEWNIPASWTLRSQLVFGSIEAPAGDKEIREDQGRFIEAK